MDDDGVVAAVGASGAGDHDNSVADADVAVAAAAGHQELQQALVIDRGAGQRDYAPVQGHSPEQRVTVGKKRSVKIKDLVPVGNYAVKIVFDDGHDTGLYTWSYLSLLGREKDKRWAQYLKELDAKGLDRG